MLALWHRRPAQASGLVAGLLQMRSRCLSQDGGAQTQTQRAHARGARGCVNVRGERGETCAVACRTIGPAEACMSGVYPFVAAAGGHSTRNACNIDRQTYRDLGRKHGIHERSVHAGRIWISSGQVRVILWTYMRCRSRPLPLALQRKGPRGQPPARNTDGRTSRSAAAAVEDRAGSSARGTARNAFRSQMPRSGVTRGKVPAPNAPYIFLIRTALRAQQLRADREQCPEGCPK
ncbi:hypothetical protein BC834DRAFT_487869 [Gloeopeniophorella convolvens]|nr:hypothetical protein BC834DRAFT_487869 [Gloeopeniophorella convolvens]